MQVSARLRNLRMSPRKVRLVIDAVRGLPAQTAVQQLAFSPKEAAGPVLKLLKSAMANAEHNDKADLSKLHIAKIVADAGTTLNRWRPRAYGRAAPIRKRTSHITIILSDESPADVHRSQVKGGKKKADKKSEKKPVNASKKTSEKTTSEKTSAVGSSKAESKSVDKKAEKKPEGQKAVKSEDKKSVKDSTKK